MDPLSPSFDPLGSPALRPRKPGRIWVIVGALSGVLGLPFLIYQTFLDHETYRRAVDAPAVPSTAPSAAPTPSPEPAEPDPAVEDVPSGVPAPDPTPDRNREQPDRNREQPADDTASSESEPGAKRTTKARQERPSADREAGEQESVSEVPTVEILDGVPPSMTTGRSDEPVPSPTFEPPSITSGEQVTVTALRERTVRAAPLKEITCPPAPQSMRSYTEHKSLIVTVLVAADGTPEIVNVNAPEMSSLLIDLFKAQILRTPWKAALDTDGWPTADIKVVRCVWRRPRR